MNKYSTKNIIEFNLYNKEFIDYCQDVLNDFLEENKEKENLYVNNLISDYIRNTVSSSLFNCVSLRKWKFLSKINKYKREFNVANVILSNSEFLSLTPLDKFKCILTGFDLGEKFFSNYKMRVGFLLKYIQWNDSDHKYIINPFTYIKNKSPIIKNSNKIEQLDDCFELEITDQIEITKKYKSIFEVKIIKEHETKVIINCKNWASLEYLLILNILIIICEYSSFEYIVNLILPYALSIDGREAIDWKCQKNLTQYRLISSNFTICPEILKALGYKIYYFKHVNDKEFIFKYDLSYPMLYIGQNFSLLFRFKVLMMISFMALIFRTGVKIRPHPKAKFTILEKLFSKFPYCKFSNKNIDTELSYALVVFGGYSHVLNISGYNHIKTFSCSQLYDYPVEKYNQNLIVNNVLFEELADVFKYSKKIKNFK